MPRVSWNDFINAGHSGALAFGTFLAPTLPAKGRLDKNKRELPTPFALLCKELDAVISGPWAAMKGGKTTPCMFMVTDPADLAAVQARFGLANATPSGPTDPWQTSYALNFSNKDYGPLARKHGFNV